MEKPPKSKTPAVHPQTVQKVKLPIRRFQGGDPPPKAPAPAPPTNPTKKRKNG